MLGRQRPEREKECDRRGGVGRDPQAVAHLGALDFIEARSNAVFLGPPGTGKSHLSIALGIRACLAGHRVVFATAAQWMDRVGAAHDAGRLQDELRRLGGQFSTGGKGISFRPALTGCSVEMDTR